MAHLAPHVEFIRRQTEAQLEAAHAQIVVARAEEMAAIATAYATNKNARYLLAAVIIATISALASAAASRVAYWTKITRDANLGSSTAIRITYPHVGDATPDHRLNFPHRDLIGNLTRRAA